ncbi:DUF5753 domain-containing protein [Paractinoplanes lichenicola]|uniref:DUF5753 domain-containing protein n=1 Tax=Paractinoplanes lichenicola TaxID=2802976 RepID=A0ABS1W108_9ACTN|nr:DUF5753 domain-containing protein [Actinoplanes lichenicola]MBL7260382.1 hypothetical protein [Actinoplanes lichenicola]
MAMAKMVDDLHDSDAFRRLRDVERVAQSIFYNAPSFVPGVLQVPAYSREIIESTASSASMDDQRLRVRDERRKAFLARLDSDAPPQVHVLLSETVFRQAPAGSAVMREQIEHLLALSDRPTVRVGVVPLERRWHRGLLGNYEVLDTAAGSLAFAEGPFGDTIITDGDRVDLVREQVRSLMNAAATGEEGRALLAKLVSD